MIAQSLSDFFGDFNGYCWLVSLLIIKGGGRAHSFLGKRWRSAFGSFMINRPSSSYSHWSEFFTRECCHDVIYVLAMWTFLRRNVIFY